MVNKQGQSYVKYASQPNLEGPILAPNSNKSEVYKCAAYLEYLGANKGQGCLYKGSFGASL